MRGQDEEGAPSGAGVNEAFGELRGALLSPSAASWHAICAALDGLDPARQAEVVPFVRDHLRRWPLALCEAPWRWVEAGLAGEPPPALAIARRLTIVDRVGVARGFRRLMRSPQLAGLERLELNEVAIGGQPAFEALARMKHLRLRHLSLEYMNVNDDLLATLLKAPWLSGLESLYLEGNTFSEAGVAALCERLSGGQLRELHLDANMLGPAGAERLARASLDGLEVLSLGYTSLGDEGVEALLRAPWMASLRQLELATCVLTERAAQAIAGSANLGALEHLSLWGNALRAEGAEALGDARGLSSLRYLGIFECQIGAAGFLALARAPWMPGLKILNARHSQITPEVLERAGKLDALGGLERLLLAFNSVEDRGLDGLLRHGRLGRLEVLELAGCGINELRALTHAPGLERLAELGLAGNTLSGGEGDVRTFARSPRSRTLRALDLSACWLNDGEVAALADGSWAELAFLSLDGNLLRGAFMDALEARPWPALHHLSLLSMPLDPDQLATLTLPHDPDALSPGERAIVFQRNRLHYTRSMTDDLAPRPWALWQAARDATASPTAP